MTQHEQRMLVFCGYMRDDAADSHCLSRTLLFNLSSLVGANDRALALALELLWKCAFAALAGGIPREENH